VRDQVRTASERAKGSEAEKPIQEAADALSKKLTTVEEALYQTKNRASQDPLNYPIRLNNKLAALGGAVASADAAPTAQSYAVYDELVAKIDAELSSLDGLLADEVPAFNRLVREKEIPAIRIAKP
jgi:kynureninase